MPLRDLRDAAALDKVFAEHTGAEKIYVVDDAEIKGYLVAPKAEALAQLGLPVALVGVVRAEVAWSKGEGDDKGGKKK